VRVGLVVPGFSAEPADWCIPALRHLVRALATEDDVTVFSLRYPYRSACYAIDGAEVIALGGALRRGPATLGLWREALAAISRAHRRQPFDVLHAFWATESGLLGSLAGRRLGVPTLVSLAGGELVNLPAVGYGDQRRAWERLKIGASVRLAHTVSAGSWPLVRLAERHVGRARRVVRAPLGVDVALFRPASDRPRMAGQTVLHVGGLVPVKDQVTLLRAVAQLKEQQPCVRLEMVGVGPLRARLGQLAGELGIAEAVHFRGEVEHDQLPAVYAAADVFALSSRHEAQAMVVLEAAACGVPCVGTAVGVVTELAPEAALAVPVADPAALAAALGAALDDPARTAQRGALACARVAADYSLAVCTARFRRLYATLVGA